MPASLAPSNAGPTPVSKLNIKKNQIKLKNDPPGSKGINPRENRLKVKI
jgi:hypothetical protein